MGLYFNPNNNSFKQAIKSQVYVDKTNLILHVNRLLGSEGKCIAISHARRFGKSQAAGMIDAYYGLGSNSRDLFSKYKIAQTENWDEHLNKYNVIHLDMSEFADNYTDNLIEKLIEYLYDEFKVVYPDVNYSKKISNVINEIYVASGAAFVIIIDEWDCVVRNQADRPELVHKYLQFLHELFKSESSKSFLALGYITGILPIKKIKDESALNNFVEYSMLESDELTPYFGFTEEEVKALCVEYSMNYDSVREWYNGYLISGRHMYNPNSVYYAMVKHSLRSYWKNTSAFGTINDFITLNYEGLKDDILAMLAGEYRRVDVRGFKNDLSQIEDKDDALTALIHLGYLGYDKDARKAFIPNYEVAEAYAAALKKGSWNEVAKSISLCEAALDAAIEGNAEELANCINAAHEAYSSVKDYNSENAMYTTLFMTLFTARAYYNVEREFAAGKGFADMVLLPRKNVGNKPAILIELKYDKSADTAIKQIKEKRYAGKLSGYADKIVLIGVNYSKKTKKHSCVIETVE